MIMNQLNHPQKRKESRIDLSLDWKIHHLKCALIPEEYKRMNKILDCLIEESNSQVTDFHKEELSFLKDLKYT